MADTSQQALSEPHTNGVVDGLTEDEKSKMRPADIDAVSFVENLASNNDFLPEFCQYEKNSETSDLNMQMYTF